MATFFKSGQTFEQQTKDPVLQMLGSGTYRDIPAGLGQSYVNGEISQEEAIAKIQGTPVFRPELGPIVNGVPQGPGGVTPLPGLGTGFATKEGVFSVPIFRPESGPQINYSTIPVTGQILGTNQGNLSTQIQGPNYPSIPSITAISPAGINYGLLPGENEQQHRTRIASEQVAKGITTIGEEPFTGQRKELSDLIAKTRGIVGDITGEAKYRLEQEQSQDILAKKAVVRSYINQIYALNNQAEAIKIAPAGANVTAFMLAGQQREALRQNAEKALLISIQLQAAQGDLQSSLDMVDELVRVKYGTLKAERDALIAQADLIIKDPRYKDEEKAQAEKIKAQEQAKEDKQKESERITGLIGSILADSDYQLTAPPEVKRKLNEIALKKELTMADYVQAVNLAAKYKKAPSKERSFGRPTPQQQSNLMSLFSQNPKSASTVDRQKLEDDPMYFWWVYNNINQ